MGHDVSYALNAAAQPLAPTSYLEPSPEAEQEALPSPEATATALEPNAD